MKIKALTLKQKDTWVRKLALGYVNFDKKITIDGTYSIEELNLILRIARIPVIDKEQ